jgi:lipopolysaccharide biosynthesis regulator YciM
MTFRLVVPLIIAFSFFLFLGYLNPGTLTFFYAPGRSVDIPYIALLLIASFAGAAALAVFYVISSFEKLLGGMRDGWHRWRGERREKLSDDARSRMSEGESAKALRKIEKVLSGDPRNFDALLLKGNLLRDLGRHKEALEVHSLALAYRPSDRSAVVQLKEDYRKAGKLDAAYRVFERVREKSPRDIGIMSGMRELAEEMGDLKRAIVLQTEIVKNVKGEDGTTSAREKLAELHCVSASRFREKGKTAEAQNELEKGRKAMPGFLPSVMMSADILEEGGEMAEAESLLRKEFKRTLSITVLMRLESVLRKTGREHEVEELYRVGMDTMGRMPDADKLLIFVALAQIESGDMAGADGTLNRAKEGFNETTIYYLARGLIEALDRGKDFPAWFHKALEAERSRFLCYRCVSCGNRSDEYFITCGSCGEWNRAMPEFDEPRRPVLRQLPPAKVKR